MTLPSAPPSGRAGAGQQPPWLRRSKLDQPFPRPRQEDPQMLPLRSLSRPTQARPPAPPQPPSGELGGPRPSGEPRPIPGGRKRPHPQLCSIRSLSEQGASEKGRDHSPVGEQGAGKERGSIFHKQLQPGPPALGRTCTEQREGLASPTAGERQPPQLVSASEYRTLPAM